MLHFLSGIFSHNLYDVVCSLREECALHSLRCQRRYKSWAEHQLEFKASLFIRFNYDLSRAERRCTVVSAADFAPYFVISAWPNDFVLRLSFILRIFLTQATFTS